MSADPISIETPEARRLADELAAMTGKPVREVVTDALQAALERERTERSRQGVSERLMAIGRRAASRPVLDDRDPDDILYDEYGLPK